MMFSPNQIKVQFESYSVQRSYNLEFHNVCKSLPKVVDQGGVFQHHGPNKSFFQGQQNVEDCRCNIDIEADANDDGCYSNE
jgi:hypothetical protein